MSQFGQPPLAAYLPLKAGQNLADLPDKAAALTNLGTLSTSDIMLNSVPLGTIIPFWGSTAPVGYLPCFGQTVNSGTFPDLVTFLGGTTSAVVPDLRGEFLRGWDNGRGIDAGRAIKTLQLDELKSHSHTFTGGDTTAGGPSLQGNRVTTGLGSTSSTGGTETRPRNVSVLYCIKAYGALVNASTANIGNVLTELSQTVKLSQFGASISPNGYQKFPSGLIIQWGTSTPTLTNVDVVFPVAFPTACTSLNQHDIGGAGGTSMSLYQFRGLTLSGFNCYNMGTISSPSGTPSFGAVTSSSCIWFATGY